ncbi:protein TonB [Sphingomonas leidyi]|uniref:Protein TonB n=2 Tax=Sphingomonadaceae TaxID=41297 RepID=A0A7X5UZ30_9SPHN|nr:protein TonB [Sphingomonas leidyi]
MGYAFVTGLAYQYIKKQAEKLNTFDVEEPPPPPEEVPPPPPPPDTPVPPPPTQIVVPPAAVPVPTQAPPIPTTSIIPPPPPITPPAPPAQPAPPPPPPAPPRIAKKLTPRGSPQGWVTDDDYPAAALRAEQAGTVRFRLDVDATGKVTNCTVTGSSGVSVLDSTACSLLKRRARFNPAEDESGNKIPAPYNGSFTWKIPS